MKDVLSTGHYANIKATCNNTRTPLVCANFVQWPSFVGAARNANCSAARTLGSKPPIRGHQAHLPVRRTHPTAAVGHVCILYDTTVISKAAIKQQEGPWLLSAMFAYNRKGLATRSNWPHYLGGTKTKSKFSPANQWQCAGA